MDHRNKPNAMIVAELPFNENERLQNLYSYEILDTIVEKDFDDLC